MSKKIEDRIEAIEKKLKINNKRLHVVLVIDESGSMHDVATDVRGGLNTYIETLKLDKAEQEVRVTYTHFDTEFMTDYIDMPLKDVPQFTNKNYCPRGGTALNEAIIRTITAVNERVKGEPVIFVVQTDGAENSSHPEYTSERVKSLIKDMERGGNYTFVYFGANQDAWAVSSTLGFNRGNTMTYNSSAKGTRAAYANLSRNTTMVRNGAFSSVGGQSATMDFFADQNVTEASADNVTVTDKDNK